MKILLVEDNPDHQRLIKATLLKAFGAEVEVDVLDTFELMVEPLNSGVYDIALVDLILPDSTFEQTVQWLNTQDHITPAVVVLTSMDDDTLGEKLVRGGVQDYVTKGDLTPGFLRRICLHAIQRREHRAALLTQNENMQTFCRSLSHDFNGAIGTISRLAQLLAAEIDKRGERTKRENDWLDGIERAANSVHEITQGLSQVLTVDASEVQHQAVDLDLLMKDVVQRLKAQAGKRFKCEFTPLGSVLGDKNQLIILFQNLIGNGIKYNQRQPVIHVSAVQDQAAGTCKISVKDNGIGMEQKYIDKIFQPFARLHSGSEFSGSGLGLSIVQRIVKNHEGEISVTSKVGEGSTFEVTLPLAH